MILFLIIRHLGLSHRTDKAKISMTHRVPLEAVVERHRVCLLRLGGELAESQCCLEEVDRRVLHLLEPSHLQELVHRV